MDFDDNEKRIQEIEENKEYENKVKGFLKDITDLRKAMVYSSLLAEISVKLGVPKHVVLEIIDQLYDTANLIKRIN